MKRIITTAILALAALTAPASAMQSVYTGQLISAPVATTGTYVLDVKGQGIDYLSEQIVYSSNSVATQTFLDGTASTATITVVSTQPLVAQQGQDTITVSTNSALSPAAGTDTLWVSSNGATALGGSTITVVGVQLYPGTHWTIGASSNSTASSIATAINNNVPNVTAAVAPVGGGSVTITCVNNGNFCNSYTVTTSTVAVLLGTGTISNKFSGGQDNTSFNLNGTILNQGNQWSQGVASSNTANSILAAVQAVPGFTASTNTSTSVLVKCASSGTFCNSFTLSASTGALTIASANFTNGQDAAFLNIQGQILQANRDWNVGSSSLTAATAIQNAINANSVLSALMIATAPAQSGVVYATSTALGTNSWSLYASTPSITVSSNTFLNGTPSAINIAANTITISSHGFPTALQVLLSTPTVGTLPVPLVGGTTYFIVDPIFTGASAPDANTLQLATTSANATASPPVVVTLASQTKNGGGKFTLTPLAMSGNGGFNWQGSNDGINWTNLSVSSVTFSNATAATSQLWDFGTFNYRQIRLNYTGPSAGAENMTVNGNGKALR